MNKKPLVSIIIPTKNSAEFLDKCLKSIKNQTYKNLEVIVVDNNSIDKTKEIARKYTKVVFNKGPERSIQRNYGSNKAMGDYLLFIDSDMELSKKVVEECMGKFKIESLRFKIGGIIIPEESFGIGFWAKCKRLERSFYVGVDWMEAARFFPKDIFHKLNGYDEELISGEDWDLSQTVKKEYKILRSKNFIIHNEGNLSLLGLLCKKFYYARMIKKYGFKNKKEFYNQSNFLKRYFLFFSNPKKLFSNPSLGFGMLFMKACEFLIGAIGYL